MRRFVSLYFLIDVNAFIHAWRSFYLGYVFYIHRVGCVEFYCIRSGHTTEASSAFYIIHSVLEEGRSCLWMI